MARVTDSLTAQVDVEMKVSDGRSPVQKAFADLENEFDGLEATVMGLISELEPVLGPYLQPSKPGDAEDDWPASSDITRLLRVNTDRIKTLRYRVAEAKDRLEV